jgi:hypothetical protein
MRSPATRQSDGTKSHLEFSSDQNSEAPIDLQARKLSQLFYFAHDTVRIVATLAYGVAQ